MLRREHLDDGTPWGRWRCSSGPGRARSRSLQRALGAAGVPVEVAGDELPLAREAAVAPLLLALRAAVSPTRSRRRSARALLLSPLGGLDSSGLRRLGRALRAHERASGQEPAAAAERGADPRGASRSPSGSTALATPRGQARSAVGAARRLGELLPGARTAVQDGGSAHDVLWLLWEATAWPHRLERTAERGGPDGRAADRDLDAVVALFEAAARDEERAGAPRAGRASSTSSPPSRSRPTPSLERRDARRRRAAADRSPQQGPRVGRRHRLRRPGGRLARPAPPGVTARGGPAARRRAGRAADACRAARPRSVGCSTSP